MTFLSNVLTKDDPNNSYTGATHFTGISTDTTGYNTLIINVVNNNGNAFSGTLTILFSSTGTSFNTVFYTDNIDGLSGSSNGNIFTKTYPIIKQYYKISFTISSGSSYNYTINTRLNTQTYNSGNINSISTFDNSQENMRDAFGKLRVSNPQTLIDLRVPGQDASGLGSTGATGYRENEIQICYGITGSGVGYTGWKVCTNSQSDIYIGGIATFKNQSRKYCVYQPGKSLLFMATGVMDAYKELSGTSNSNPDGMISKIGYFDDYNGLYFQYIANGSGGGTGSINVKNNNIITTSITQSSWNIDKMNGTGISGLKLDWTKTQLFVIDMEWLGVGRVRFGFYAYGQIQYCHEILNLNSISFGPYTFNINLPVRYELKGNSAGTTGAMIQICSTVISEGGYTPIGRPFSVSILDVSAPGSIATIQPIFFLRGGNSYGNYYHQQILPTDITIASTSVSDIGIVRLILYLPINNTPISNTVTWQDANTNLSVAQYGISGTVTSTNSIIVHQSTFSGRGSVSFSNLGNIFTDLLQITSDINNNSAILEVNVQGTFGGSSKLYASLSWTEIY